MKTLNEQLEIAIELAIKYHKGQIDKGGNAYILHPLEVMNNVNRMESKIVAVLHDIIEDTECSVDTLREWGINEDAIESINVLILSKSILSTIRISALLHSLKAKLDIIS